MSTLDLEKIAKKRILLPSKLAMQIEQHAVRAYPEECCGVLIGTTVASDVVVRRAAAAENIAVGDRRKQYQVDWASLFEAVRQTRDSQQAIVGFYHSHPDETDQPSRLDYREAWIDYAYLIVGVTGCGVSEMACWRVHDEGTPFRRETVERMESR